MLSLSQGAKRSLDVVASALALAALLPALPLIALAIVAESRGPVFVLRPAVGVQRRRPRAAGSRTDGSADDPRRLHDVGGALLRLPEFRLTTVARAGAPARLTRTGRWLARTHLAHWPRFASVLRGDLALVGPRPLSPRRVAELLVRAPGWERQLVGVRPGLLGPAQAQGRPGAGWVSALRDRVLFELDYGTRLAQARGVRDVLALDLSVVRACCARALRSRVPRGHEVIRIDAPTRFAQAGVDGRALLQRGAMESDGAQPGTVRRDAAANGASESAPSGAWDAASSGAWEATSTPAWEATSGGELRDGVLRSRATPVEVHPHGDRVTAFWYPPRRRAVRVPMTAESTHADLLHTTDEPFEVRWLVPEEQPDRQLLILHALHAEAGAAGAGDELHVELPAGLHEVARVCEQLLPLWEALGERRGDAALGCRVTRLLLAGFARVAAGRVDGRITLDVHVGSDRLVLQINALLPLPELAAGEFALPRMVLAPSLGALPSTFAATSGSGPQGLPFGAGVRTQCAAHDTPAEQLRPR